MNLMPKAVKTIMSAACLAAVATMMIPAQPAQAGMGTGNPPPPPPPPHDVKQRFFEGSSDSNLGGRGFPGIPVNKRPSIYDSRRVVSTTDSAGSFSYTIATGDAISHSGYMFGIQSPAGNGDIFVATDAIISLKVASNEKEFDALVASSAGASRVTKWKASYEFLRPNSNPYLSNNFELDVANRAFPTIKMPRNLNAKPLQTPITATFQLNELDGYDAEGVLRLKWLDKKENGSIALKPGKNGTLSLREIRAVTAK